MSAMVRLEWQDGDDRNGDEGVAVITLDRPDRRNAVDHATLLALLDALAAVADARAVVLTGAPPAFCAGADLAGVREDVFSADLRRVLTGFAGLPVPVIAAVDGPAFGAGAQLLAVSDLRVATPRSTVAVPAAKLGLVIDQWTVERFANEFGRSITRDLLMAASTYSADRLYAAGVVHRLGELDDAIAWATEIARLAPLSIAGHKLALETLGAPSPVDDEVAAAQRRAWGSDDAAEGRQAFLDKRPPAFTGR
jgi:enoyl-CoA hydratase